MFRKPAFLVASLLLLCMNFTLQAITVHTIGDSTMSDYEESTTDKRGWAMMFQQFFDAGHVTINNRAKSGASSKSFYKETGYWNTVKSQIVAGDYVFVQFAHNDEKNNGLDGDTVRATTDPAADYRGTSAQGTFKVFLRAYVNESRALGGIPVLVTPMCRKYFSGSTITRKGQHDLGGDLGLAESDNTHDYVQAIKDVAVEMQVPLIDLTAATKSLLESYGDAASTSLLFCKDDSTHPNALGATLIARLCAQAMTTQNILAQYVKASSDVLVNPGKHDFGNGYTGQNLIKEFSIAGFDLSPAAGSFTLTVSDGFGIALQRTDVYNSTLSLNYSAGNLDYTRLYVSAGLTAAGTKTGTLTVSNGILSKSFELTANCIQISGGTPVKLRWELSANADAVLSGPATHIEESYSGMYLQRYSAPNTVTYWPAASGYDATHKTQRNAIVGDAWPAGEIDEVSTRYIQFGIKANDGNELNIDSIGLYVGGAGGNGMRCRISYSTSNFADYTAIAEFQSMVANTMYAVEAIPVVKLYPGESLLLRVYPWYNGAATGKTICLADVTIRGIASGLSAVKKIADDHVKCYLHEGKLVIQGIEEDYTFRISDLTGKNLHSSHHSAGELNNLPAPENQGMYVAEIETKAGRYVRKFVK